jgi:hypothetical protein
MNIIKFFIQNPNPVDNQIHKFAESLNIDYESLENIIYEMFTSFIECLDKCNSIGDRSEEIVYSETALAELDKVDIFVDALKTHLSKIDPNIKFESLPLQHTTTINFDSTKVQPYYSYQITKAIIYSQIPKNSVNVVRRGSTVSVRITH